MRGHISYSEIKIWDECAYKHKLMYIDNIKNFHGNEHTAFGTAMHEVCEKAVLNFHWHQFQVRMFLFFHLGHW